MAALIAVTIGIGAEKLGRIISEKRLEHKDKKAAQKREAMYSHAESSSGHAAARTKLSSRRQEKIDEMRREDKQSGRRRSVSSEMTLVPEQPPPRYEDVVRDDARHA
ncbi:hypothetical protein HBI56_069270 [Parastagonospora nodorum]|uniref:Uncharacterized protein n=1 Tax=Phaeosphaeria nodorum (strain SN15 / ATCC MYA-4574 / FGSC 10173) TaxID=321614 RepID=A0A7U2ESF9_PHANO|nr:hypothetical protein HBH56_003710 [Parastagonospora nodorum]QRC90289.1 hypothetical protein JI435_096950 [Parastagonospora nodorum SN15]KAH3938106.1 hypothetical protein HBH54_003700 [Parastagonospora nodorum]KAH3946773.1 hypothetical protein HBH53_128290 [Parastagonospora nodorum]KAH3975136.1 hypothetical protein HBH51_086470 [Parastagonospora nodorum]